MIEAIVLAAIIVVQGVIVLYIVNIRGMLMDSSSDLAIINELFDKIQAMRDQLRVMKIKVKSLAIDRKDNAS